MNAKAKTITITFFLFIFTSINLFSQEKDFPIIHLIIMDLLILLGFINYVMCNEIKFNAAPNFSEISQYKKSKNSS
jgi:hypothetical protein